VVVVPTAEFKLKNLGEVVAAQDGCFSEIIITATLYLQEVNSIELPFGNYQPSGNLEEKIDTTVSLVWLHETLDII
jgi:hypothetical protein